ncbi:MAG: glycosyltransferase, partial [Bacteroidota bacterium]
MKTPDYSVIVPVFNSEESLEELLEQIKKSFQSLEKTFEVIFVDDCSPDNSWEVLQKLKEDNPGDNIVLIRLTQNFGQHKATYCGMNYAKAEFM